MPDRASATAKFAAIVVLPVPTFRGCDGDLAHGHAGLDASAHIAAQDCAAILVVRGEIAGIPTAHLFQQLVGIHIRRRVGNGGHKDIS